MGTPIKDGQIVKRDEKGRLRITKEQREALLTEYEQSQMTGVAFARWAGIPYGTFMTWVYKRRKEAKPIEKKEGRAVSVEWVEAVVENSAEVPLLKERKKEPALKMGAALVVEGPGGIRLELSEERHVLWAAKLLRHWGGHLRPAGRSAASRQTVRRLEQGKGGTMVPDCAISI